MPETELLSENTQINGVKESKSTNVITLIGVGLLGVIAGIILISFIRPNKSVSQPLPNITQVTPTIIPPTPEPVIKKLPLETKKISQSQTLAAFLSTDQSLPTGIYFVGWINSTGEGLDNSSGVIVSRLYDAYSSDNVFDTLKDKIYVINSEKNQIEAYNTDDFSSAGYIPYPGYKVGTLYAIKCSGTICQIKSAFHQESGCDMNLNMDTKSYSIPVCHAAGPDGNDYTPEKK